MKFIITIKNQIKALEGVFISTGTFILFILAYSVYNEIRIFSSANFLFFIFYLFSVAPALYLHLEFYFLNKNTNIIIDNSLKQIIINEHKFIDFDSIYNATFYMAPSVIEKRFIKFFAFEDYYFVRFNLADNEKIIISCLMNNNLKAQIESMHRIKIEYKKMLFSTTFW